MPEPEVVTAPTHAITGEEVQDWMKVREAQRDAASQHADAFSDEFAVEVEDVRGETRVDHKGIPIRNADGTLNAAGKAWLEINEPVDRLEQEIADRMRADDYQPEPGPEPPRTEPLGFDLEARVAKKRGLALVEKRSEAGGRPLVMWGRRLYRNKHGALRRLVAHHGRVVEYGA